MRVLAISQFNYSQKLKNSNITKPINKIKQIEQPQEEQKETAPAFKGAGMGVLGAIAGGMVGFIVGGPIGAAAGATLLGSFGSGQNDKTSEDSYTYNIGDEYGEGYKLSHYDG